MKLFLLMARLLIGFVFVVASYHKILDPENFAGTLRNYMIISESYSNLIALTLPWIEMGTGLLLIAGIWVKPAALLSTAMLVCFLGALVFAYVINLDIDCGCFYSDSSSEGRIGVYHLVRDSFLVSASAFMLFSDDQGKWLRRFSLFNRKAVSVAVKDTSA